jgi:gamma-glutamyl hydrolase
MKFGLTTLFIAVLLVATIAHDHPMVGLMSYPGSPSARTANSYIQGESAKFIESSGARNVVIPYDQEWITSEDVLKNLNGIFIQNSFNGEMSNDEILLINLQNAYDYTVEQNENGEVFPLWTSGVTGLQLLEVIQPSNGASDFAVPIDALDYAATLKVIEFKTPNDKVSVTSNIRDAFMKPLSTEEIVYFNQDRGITVESFNSNDFLSSTFEIVATSKDRQGVEFIAIMKNKAAPVVISFVLFEAVYNFFPETNVPHTSNAARTSVQFSKAFTDFCRVNDRTLGSVEAEYKNNLFNNKMTTVADREYQTFYF